MIEGIPYFGEDNNLIYSRIINSDITDTKYYDSIYEFIESHIDKKVIVLIDKIYLTWLNDIKFNYRDKQVYIPYYTYKEFEVDNDSYRTNNKGHIKSSEDMTTFYIRYEYNYKKYNIDVNNFKLTIYDLETSTKYRVELSNNKWYNKHEFDAEELYEYYIDSCYKDDDFMLTKHMGGYHYINKSIAGFENREKKLREIYGLDTYDIETTFDKDYRDVRNYKYNEVVHKIGIRNTLENYKIRRLRFELLLYCIMRDKLKPSNSQFKDEWNKLGINKDYIKYGNSIKLIFKSYWLDQFRAIKIKSWSRIGGKENE